LRLTDPFIESVTKNSDSPNTLIMQNLQNEQLP
jgi:hypothetical protein